MNERELTFIDLFSGCGGFSLGLKLSGWNCVQAIEIDEFAAETYTKNLGHSPLVQDIRNINSTDFKEADLLVGGFPCQPFSLSGLQRGYFGDDGDLFMECVRAIKATKAKIFVLENVTGFARLHGGLFMRIAMRELRKIGYSVDWKIVKAVEFGVPQTRERLLLIGNRLGIKNFFPEPTFRGASVKDAIDDLRYRTDITNHEPMKHTDAIIKRFAATKQGETTRDAMDRDPTLGNAKITKQCYRRLIESEPAPTVVANFVTTTIHYSENRNLTAREAARIQSFPDDFEFYGLKTRMSWQAGLSQFEQIGNAVPPMLAKSIGAAVRQMLEKPEKFYHSGFEGELFDSEEADLVLVNKLIKKVSEKKSNTVKRRGRKSKYQEFYEVVEKCTPGERVAFPENADEAFETFFLAAMRRRRINVKIDQASKLIEIL